MFWSLKWIKLYYEQFLCWSIRRNGLGNCLAVWLDVVIKSSPNFPNNAQKGATAVFTYNLMLFTVA